MFSSVKFATESYKFFEPLPIGPYTLQFWSVSPLLDTPNSHNPYQSNNQTNNRKNSNGLQLLQSYLPPGTGGKCVPQFKVRSNKLNQTNNQSNNQSNHWNQFESHNESNNQTNNQSKWQLAIYKEGNIIAEPKEDEDLKEFNWVQNHQTPWMNQIIKKEELLKILRDLFEKYEPQNPQVTDKLIEGSQLLTAVVF